MKRKRDSRKKSNKHYKYQCKQHLPFAGVKETIAFLKTQTTIEGKKAFDYVSECSKCGDFDSLVEYFSKDALPWWI